MFLSSLGWSSHIHALISTQLDTEGRPTAFPELSLKGSSCLPSNLSVNYSCLDLPGLPACSSQLWDYWASSWVPPFCFTQSGKSLQAVSWSNHRATSIDLYFSRITILHCLTSKVLKTVLSHSLLSALFFFRQSLTLPSRLECSSTITAHSNLSLPKKWD